MKFGRGSVVAALAVVIAAGLYLRLASIRTYSPNPDEFHWVSRSAKVLERYSAGEISRLTNHLGHPGIPPAVAMAAFQYLGDSWNRAVNAERGTSRYIDHLSASRLSNLVWFVLIVPLIFFGCRKIIGDPAALLTSALISFDTQHIVNTRVAHIDGALTLLTLCCVLLYFDSQRRRSLYLKIVSGAAWGLCISVKPTAMALIPGFVLVNLFWNISAKRSGSPDDAPPPIAWSDLLAVIVGLVTLAGLHTRFWDPNSRLLRIHHISPAGCAWINSIGSTVQSLSPLPQIIFVGLMLLAFYCWRKRASLPRAQRIIPCIPAIFVVGSLIVLIAWFPTITANLVRYFYWVGGLSEMPHKAYGVTVDPPVGGYLRIFLSRTSPWVMFGFIAAILWMISELRKPERWEWIHRHRELISFLLVAAVWTAFLSSSPKQAYRYILPIMPLITAVAAFGIIRTAETISRGATLRYPLLAVGVLIIPQLIPVFSVKPDYGFYFTSYTGGVAGAMKAGASVLPARYEQAFEKIDRYALEHGQEQVLEVGGDFNLLLASYRRNFLPDHRHVKIVPYQSGLGSDWLINFPYYSHDRFKDINRYGNLTLDSEFIFDGGKIFELYRVNPLPHGIRIQLPFAETARETGKLYVDKATDQSALELDVDDDRPGLGVFGMMLKVPAGRIKLFVTAALHELRDSPADEIMTIALNRRCAREIRYSEFGVPPKADTFQTFEVSCEISQNSRIEPSLLWFANQSVLVKEVAVEID